MSNPLKKTMVFLGLAEEDLDIPDAEYTAPQDETPAPQAHRAPQKATVTPLRRVTPTRSVGASGMNEILTVRPTSYSDAPMIAESFRDGIPVIINLSAMNDNDARRLIDFASGLITGLRGSIERVTSKVFLLTPEHISISGEEQPASDTGSFFVSPTA